MVILSRQKIKKPLTLIRGFFCRAEDEARTRDNQLGRLELYQLSYFRFCECKYKGFVSLDANFFSIFLKINFHSYIWFG